MAVFFEFLDDRYWLGAPRAVAVGPTDVVRATLTEEQLLAAFGGYVAYVDDQDGQTYLGVLGEHRIQRFLKVLRAKGVAVETIDQRPRKLRLHGRRESQPHSQIPQSS